LTLLCQKYAQLKKGRTAVGYEAAMLNVSSGIRFTRQQIVSGERHRITATSTPCHAAYLHGNRWHRRAEIAPENR